MGNVDWDAYFENGVYDRGVGSLYPHRLYRKEFARSCELSAGMDILAVGSGSGLMLQELLQREPECSVLGLEYSKGGIAAAKLKFLGNTRVRFERVDLNQSHWTEESEFDLVVCALVLYAIADPLIFLRRIRAKLRHGGRFVISNAWRADPERVLKEHADWLANEASQADKVWEDAVSAERAEAIRINRALAVQSDWHMMHPDSLVALMTSAGFEVMHRDDDQFAGTVTLVVACAV